MRFPEELTRGMTRETAKSLFDMFPDALELVEGCLSMLHWEHDNNPLTVIERKK